MNCNIGKSVKKYASGLLVLATILSLSSCTSQPEPPAGDVVIAENQAEGTLELSQAQFESSEMELGQVEMRTFHNVVKAKGMIDVPPENRAEVGAYFGGTVKELRLLTGQQVKKGEVLFILENPDFVQIQQDYLEAKGQLTYLESDYERQKNLAADNVSSQKNFLKSESDYTVTVVRLEALGKKLMLMNIDPGKLSIENIKTTIAVLSPMNGYVTQIDISIGSFLMPSQTAIAMVNTDHLHLELTVFEKDLPTLQAGQVIEFSIQEEKDKKYQALVYLINKTVDPINRTVGIHGHIKDEKRTSILSPGMYVEADIYTTSESKASLPEEALVEINGKYFALVLQERAENGYSFVKKQISIGEMNDGYVEVLNASELGKDAQILIKRIFNLITE